MTGKVVRVAHLREGELVDGIVVDRAVEEEPVLQALSGLARPVLGREIGELEGPRTDTGIVEHLPVQGRRELGLDRPVLAARRTPLAHDRRGHRIEDAGRFLDFLLRQRVASRSVVDLLVEEVPFARLGRAHPVVYLADMAHAVGAGRILRVRFREGKDQGCQPANPRRRTH